MRPKFRRLCKQKKKEKSWMGVIGDKLRARLGASRATSTPTPTPTTSATATTAAATVAQNSSNNSRPRRSLSAKLYGSGADSSSSGEDDDEVQEPEFTQNDLDYSQDSSEEEMQEEEESEESEAAEEDDEDFEEEYGDPVKTDPGRTTRSSRKQTVKKPNSLFHLKLSLINIWLIFSFQVLLIFIV